MFDQVCENVARAAETSLRMQQEAFKTWVRLWPGASAAGLTPEEARRFDATWAEFCEDVLKKQWQAWAVQFEAGMKHIDDASRLASQSVELWWVFFEALQMPRVPAATAVETLERSALEQALRGLPPPREVYDAQNRSHIDWSRFPAWARPSDPELFEGGHEG